MMSCGRYASEICQHQPDVWDLFTGIYDVVSGLCRCCRNRCAEALNALGELGGVCMCTLEFPGIMGCCYGNIYGVLASTEKQKLR